MVHTLEHKDGLVEIVENEKNKRVLHVKTPSNNQNESHMMWRGRELSITI